MPRKVKYWFFDNADNLKSTLKVVGMILIPILCICIIPIVMRDYKLFMLKETRIGTVTDIEPRLGLRETTNGAKVKVTNYLISYYFISNEKDTIEISEFIETRTLRAEELSFLKNLNIGESVTIKCSKSKLTDAKMVLSKS